MDIKQELLKALDALKAVADKNDIDELISSCKELNDPIILLIRLQTIKEILANIEHEAALASASDDKLSIKERRDVSFSVNLKLGDAPKELKRFACVKDFISFLESRSGHDKFASVKLCRES